MSLWVYMSLQKGVQVARGKISGLSVGGTQFRCRGEISNKTDDPQGFKNFMARGGHMVVFHSTRVGEPDSKGVFVASAEELSLASTSGVIDPQ